MLIMAIIFTYTANLSNTVPSMLTLHVYKDISTTLRDPNANFTILNWEISSKCYPKQVMTSLEWGKSAIPNTNSAISSII